MAEPSPGIVLYSALYGRAEAHNPEVFGDVPAARRVIVTDNPDLTCPNAEIVFDPQPDLDPVRAARRPKHMPHLYFPDADWTIWIDNKSKLLAPPDAIVAAVAAQSDAGLFTWPHFARSCLYDEARAVIENGLDDPAIVRRQIRAYRRLGMPPGQGLIESHFLVRRNRPDVAEFGERWHAEVLRYSRRDQIAFPFVVWQTGFRFAYITALDRAQTVKLSVLDRVNRVPQFRTRSRFYLGARKIYRQLLRR